MKEKKNGWLPVLIVVAAIALCSYVALVGIGKGHKGSIENIRLGLDLAGGVSITYETDKDNPSAEEMDDTVYKMQKRAENYSTEAQVYKEGTNRINVDIPGVTDANEILQQLGKAGSIGFYDESGNLVIEGSDIETAEATTQKNQTTGLTEYVVKLTLNAGGKDKFAQATAANVGKQIAIVYDQKTISAPVVSTTISDGVAIISGQETMDEANELASVIRIGALPLQLNEVRSNVVGAKLGLEAINTSLLAGIIGFILVILFMIVVYRVPGFVASIALILYLAAEMVILNVLNVTLTLPGVAGIILSIGMAVDANVIIFTRIKEEIGTGKTVQSAIKLGFDKALSAIIDSNVTTIIAAVVLYFMGSGTVKGFATTLAIGVILSMFTALTVTKHLLRAFYNLGCDNEKLYGIKKETKTWNFIGMVKKTYVIAIVVIGFGIAMLFVNKAQIGEILNYGLDFRGGTSTEITFNEALTDDTQKDVEAVFQGVAGSNVETSKVQNADVLIVKTGELTLDQRTTVEDALVKDFAVDAANIKTESISANVSNEMKSDAILSVIVACFFMLIYIWVRFKDLKFGAAAVISLINDVFVVLMVYAAVRISVGSTFIACMLTILGYSINATIVVFDRVRENMGGARSKEALAEIVNKSITDTFSRSVNTTITTLIMVVMLAILGVDSVREFAIPLMAGILAGAFSSVCISGTVYFFFRTKFAKSKKR